MLRTPLLVFAPATPFRPIQHGEGYDGDRENITYIPVGHIRGVHVEFDGPDPLGNTNHHLQQQGFPFEAQCIVSLARGHPDEEVCCTAIGVVVENMREALALDGFEGFFDKFQFYNIPSEWAA